MTTILIVEDDEAYVYAVARTLEDAGYRVIPTCDAMKGLAALEAERPDLLVTDIRMPQGQPHGLALARMARARYPGLPVIYITAFPQLVEEDTSDAPDYVLTKPVSAERLLAEVRAHVSA